MLGVITNRFLKTWLSIWFHSVSQTLRSVSPTTQDLRQFVSVGYQDTVHSGLESPQRYIVVSAFRPWNHRADFLLKTLGEEAFWRSKNRISSISSLRLLAGATPSVSALTARAGRLAAPRLVRRPVRHLAFASPRLLRHYSGAHRPLEVDERERKVARLLPHKADASVGNLGILLDVLELRDVFAAAEYLRDRFLLAVRLRAVDVHREHLCFGSVLLEQVLNVQARVLAALPFTHCHRQIFQNS